MRNRQLSVSALVRYLKGKLDQDPLIQRVIVAGEISNFTAHRSGHWYFTLKDEKSRISCVMFASNAARCKFIPKEGDSVLVQANTSIFEASGQLQLYVTAMKPTGLGDLYLKYEELKRRLHEEGLFDPARKKPLPQYPMRIVVITGKNTAARQDVVTTLARRWPIAQVSEIPVLVQGEGAAAQICAALRQADTLGFDVMILARGGGSIEDLWSFNEECVARTMAGLKTPVICGVGHEVDVTIADLVADRRAPTPTGAAEMATPQLAEVQSHCLRQRQQLIYLMNQKLRQQRQRYQQQVESRIFQDPMSLLQPLQMRLDYDSSRLQNTTQRLRSQRARLDQLSAVLLNQTSRQVHLQQQRLGQLRLNLNHHEKQQLMLRQQQLKEKIRLLDAYSPLKILGRGYGLIAQNGHLVRSIQEVNVNEELRIRLHDGQIQAHVKEKEEQA